MNKISKINVNFKIELIKENDISFFNVREEPFRVYGLYDYKTEGKFKRLPESVAKATSAGVYSLNYNTAGGRVRFKTDSKYVAIKTIMDSVSFMPDFPLSGSSGFDLYINNKGKSIYYKTFMPPIEMKDGYESIIYFADGKERDITINFPLYNDVNQLYIGLQTSAKIKSGDMYKIECPVVFYGSSITQGRSASRPGNSYEAIISRNIDCDYINLGFSGNAKGEDALVNYMSGMNMSAFVCDYDHNAPNEYHLEATHEKLYKKIREKNKELPIILISKPDFDNGYETNIIRRDVIYKTFINAINNEDKNIYYIDGQRLFQNEGRDCCTVDGCHPNDLGFYRMAETIGYIIKNILLKT